jgi:hypothetical protein
MAAGRTLGNQQTHPTIAELCNPDIHFSMDQPALDRFDWALVKSFLAVLDAGSLMGAARRLNAQQPTLSRHVAELEAQLGAPLFERTGRGVTPGTRRPRSVFAWAGHRRLPAPCR